MLVFENEIEVRAIGGQMQMGQARSLKPGLEAEGLAGPNDVRKYGGI
jgi:hypothetical protein